MMQRLHHWLIPSKRNNYHPKSLRPLGLALFVLVLAFIPTLYNVTTTHNMQVLGYATNITIGDLHAVSNTERSHNGVPALRLNSKLNQAAANKASHMFAHDYWAHNAPDGTTPWAFMSGAGYVYYAAGENLAKNFSTSAGVVNGWMNSPGHRANVLNKTFVDVGYAVMNGVLQGQETTLVVAMYAAPYAAPAAKSTPAAPTTTAKAEPAPSTTTPTTEKSATAKKETKKTTEKKTEPVAVTEAVTSAVQQATETAELPPSPAEVAGAIISAPVEAYTGLNWGQKASIFIMCALALLFIMKHTLIWRSRKKGVQHIWLKSHPLAQASFLIAASIITLLSGTGAVL